MPKRSVGVFALALGLVSCVNGAERGPTPAVSTFPSSTVSASPAATSTSIGPSIEHRIGVRAPGGIGEFYDRINDETFVPRGVNLVRLSFGGHSTLDVGRYDPIRIDAALSQISDYGFNVVRVFLNSRPGGLPDGSGLSAEYLDNAADLLERAKDHDLFVMFTQDWLPESAGWQFASDPLIDNVNAMYLSTGGVEANRRFFSEFVQGLVARGAAVDALWAYELRNELYFSDLYEPFSLSSGLVEPAGGGTYDLAVDGERRRLLEDGLIHWVDEMRGAIVDSDPTALVTVGFFQPHGPNPSRIGDDRLIETERVILESSADFIDLHAYPGGELDLPSIVENYGLPSVTEKPIVLGEFGAEHSGYPRTEDAVRALVGWQMESCGFGFDGWLLWTWDTGEQPEFWNALNDGGQIADALSSTTRPDPCALGQLDLPVELTADATANASTFLSTSPPDHAIDGLVDTIWNAAADSPQWIEIDLGDVRTVEQVRLLVAQDPPGRTLHHVVAGLENGSEEVVVTFDQETTEGDWLEFVLAEPLSGVRYLRIETVTSPSWTAWREVSILGS